jgi:hypothetical protein
MSLTNFAVKPTAETDYSVVVKADAGQDQVAAYIARRAIDDYFRQHCPLTDGERVGLIESNLHLISSTITTKYEGGQTQPEHRFESTIRRIEIGLEDLLGGPRLDDGRVLILRGAGFRRPRK